jgi:hypothetical protein
MLEESFSRNASPEDNWIFDYIIVRNLYGKIILATFVTTALWKDDMLEPSFVSHQIEEGRINNRYYLTSKVITTGSLITEGEHLYIDKSSTLWKEAMQLLIEKLYSLQEKNKANSIVLRDFHTNDTSFDDLMVDNGFFRISMPDTNRLENITWKNKEAFQQQLSKCSKEHFRKKVRRHENRFQVEIKTGPASEEELNTWYDLYCNVKNRSLELNTFHLPKKLFANMVNNENWEVLTLKLKTEHTDIPETVCIVFSYKSSDSYVPMIIGLDYKHNKEFNIYRQALYQLVVRCTALGKKKMYLGFSASIEKRKMGATTTAVHAYMNVKDSFNHEVLSGINKISEKSFVQT